MFTDSFVVFDHSTDSISIVCLCILEGDRNENYRKAVDRIDELQKRLKQPVPEIGDKDSIHHEAVSNVGRSGYTGMVAQLKQHIIDGDIIQAVPSQKSKTYWCSSFHIYQQLEFSTLHDICFILNK